ncbi:hypothetical protein Psyc_0075 [Psychrobacter arcticus 273-4]|uniref:Uncharacterized protein n=1 Tax=Psychrobacter arcticus (strain DSM 17307 / VKM B-2377 / 273-4) TaxID=259536 RepID=Q4FVK9_PSYA2|nr:hypothetical protein Psyc_0075 [Psychrobacter arcticus 273-4]
MKSNIDTTGTAGANFSCLLCLRRQRLQKIYTSNTVATLKYFNYILNSSAQLLIVPVNSAALLLDPILTRAKTLYPDNYQRYYRACRDGIVEIL